MLLVTLGLGLGGIAPLLLQSGAAQSHGVQPAGFRRGVEPGAECRSTLVGVAHQDDDLLFISPEVQRLIRGRCSVGTVYLTAGDAGRSFTDDSYVRRREQGVRAAYARMAGVPNRWHRADLTVRRRSLVSFVLTGRPDVRLVFLRLPDGFPKGVGSPRYAGQSLLKLLRGQIAAITPVDGASSYTGEELTSVLSEVLALRKAERVLTLDYDSATFGVGPPNPADHSDHEMAGRFFRKAAYRSPARPDVTPYVGYGLPLLPANLTGRERRDKEAVHAAYVAHAGCFTVPCSTEVTLSRVFRLWMRREHRRVHRRPASGEIRSAIGRTGAKAVVERCLVRDVDRPAAEAVATADCDGGPGQRWTFVDGTIRAAGTAACLTAAPRITVSPCDGSGRQIWWRDADGRIGSGDRCLHQDDLAVLHPRLGLRACSPYQPELRWQW
ncbi:PIG-L family deacetylase [Streptomyces sp. NPDC127106]|uniref:PIG-L family deacetylase n=1 Tax=Streptomyces sp. NPDC127106 TaxID=3345360 RepID=UPI00363E8369